MFSASKGFDGIFSIKALFREIEAMLEKYRAIIHGDRIEWEGEAPEELEGSSTIKVDVTVVSDKPALKKPNGKKMAEALAKIAARGALPIEDPLKWQREMRKDRPLPGRD